MTQQNPFEAPTAATQISRPSIAGPTMLTALAAALLFAVPSIARGIDPGVSCCWNCTAGILIGCLGALPAWMLSRQGHYFTGGHGFAAAFFGVGCGSGLGVFLQMVSPGMGKARLHEWTGELARLIAEESERQRQPLPVPEAELRETLERVFLAAPIPMALVGTVVAGFVGVLTLNLLSRRRQQHYPPPTQPPPTQPPLTQPPPTEPPVNPYSNQHPRFRRFADRPVVTSVW